MIGGRLDGDSVRTQKGPIRWPGRVGRGNIRMSLPNISGWRGVTPEPTPTRPGGSPGPTAGADRGAPAYSARSAR